MDILSILGSALGSSLSGGSQLGSLIGGAIGTKLGGGSSKDAIKNALLQGVLGGGAGGGDFNSMMQQAALQSMLSGGGRGGGRDTSGIMALMAMQSMGGGQGNPLAALFGGGMGAGSRDGQQQGGGMTPQMLFSGLGSLAMMDALMGGGEQPFKELYASRYTGLRYDTPEERDRAEQMYEEKMGYPANTAPRGYAGGGYIEGPGTGRSDSIPAMIHQGGRPVQRAALSDGEFVMTERAVRGAGSGDREAGAAKMYRMMREFERGTS